MNNILDIITSTQAIIIAISALITTVVVEYLKIRKMLSQQGIEEARKELEEMAAPFIGTAENNPLSVLNGLINIPRTEHNIPLTQKTANTNEGKALVVAQAAIEQAKDKKPSILKKLGINSALDAVPIISGLYQGIIKPALKRK
jgi:hypothetical protein